MTLIYILCFLYPVSRRDHPNHQQQPATHLFTCKHNRRWIILTMIRIIHIITYSSGRGANYINPITTLQLSLSISFSLAGGWRAGWLFICYFYICVRITNEKKNCVLYIKWRQRARERTICGIIFIFIFFVWIVYLYIDVYIMLLYKNDVLDDVVGQN